MRGHRCPQDINCIYIRQAEALGLGHAVLCAQAGGRRRALRRDPRRRPDRRRAAGAEADGRRLRLVAHARCSACRTCRARRPAATASSPPSADGRAPRAHRPASSRSRSPRRRRRPSAVVGRYVLTPRIFHHLRAGPARRRRRDPAHRRASPRCSRERAGAAPTASRARATTAAPSSATSGHGRTSALRHQEVGAGLRALPRRLARQRQAVTAAEARDLLAERRPGLPGRRGAARRSTASPARSPRDSRTSTRWC